MTRFSNPVDINQLYKAAVDGESGAEDRLFSELTVSFRLIAQRKVDDVNHALEITQEALMTIVAKYRTISFDRSFAAWAHQVLTYKIMDFYKSRRVRHDYRQDTIARIASSNPGNPDPMLKIRLLRCLEKLTEINGRYAQVLGMSTDGHSTAEICEKMMISKNNLWVILSRARSILASCLETGEVG